MIIIKLYKDKVLVQRLAADLCTTNKISTTISHLLFKTSRVIINSIIKKLKNRKMRMYMIKVIKTKRSIVKHSKTLELKCKNNLNFKKAQ